MVKKLMANFWGQNLPQFPRRRVQGKFDYYQFRGAHLSLQVRNCWNNIFVGACQSSKHNCWIGSKSQTT